MASLPLKWVPPLLALIIATIIAGAYAIFRDPEASLLMEAFAVEAAAEARADAKAAASPHPAMTDEDFARHAVKVGLYSKIYGAFVAELGEPAAGESVAEVAEAYRTGAATLDGLREFVRGMPKGHWKREASARGGSGDLGGERGGGERGGGDRPSVAGHVRALASALGEHLPSAYLRTVESALAQGFVTMQDLWENVQRFKEDFRRDAGATEGFAGDAGATEGSSGDAGATEGAPREAQDAGGNAPSPVNPEDFRRPDGTFDVGRFNKAFSGSPGQAAPSAPVEPASARRAQRSELDRSLVRDAVVEGTGAEPETFRRADGTFDTAAFNRSFSKKLEEGRAARAGSPDPFGGVSRSGPGVALVGAGERNDGRSGEGRGKTGSAGEARAFMLRIAKAEGAAENREPYRVFPFPHAPPFIPARFADDTEPLQDRVSAVYRTVFGSPPDRETRTFLAGRLRAWGGDMRRLSNLVSTMHSMASADAARLRETRDRAVKDVVRALSEGAGEGDAEAERIAADIAAKAAEEIAAASSASSGPPSVGISEVAGVSSRLLGFLERDGLGPDEAIADVETALKDWSEAQLAIAEARKKPRSATDAYLNARDLGTLATSRQFEDPVVGL